MREVATFKMPDAATAHLSVRDLHAFYGESHILHGMTFTVPRGEVVTLLGRNGAGKTTTMRAAMGLIPSRRGSIAFDGVETIAMPSHRIARLGIAYCPEERGIFSSLNVRENLMLPPVVKPGGMSVEEVYELFPRLKERSTSQGTKLPAGKVRDNVLHTIWKQEANNVTLFDSLLRQQCRQAIHSSSKLQITIRTSIGFRENERLVGRLTYSGVK